MNSNKNPVKTPINVTINILHRTHGLQDVSQPQQASDLHWIIEPPSPAGQIPASVVGGYNYFLDKIHAFLIEFSPGILQAGMQPEAPNFWEDPKNDEEAGF